MLVATSLTVSRHHPRVNRGDDGVSAGFQALCGMGHALDGGGRILCPSVALG